MTTPDRPSSTAGHTPIDPGPVTSADDLAAATAWLDDAEAAAGIPLVDEGERERLARATDGARPAQWRPFLLRLDGHPVGYAAAAGTLGDVDHVAGDLAVAVDHPQLSPAAIRSAGLGVLRAAARDLAPDRARVQVWMRHVDERHLAELADDGFEVARRLGILGRELSAPVTVPAVDDVIIRAYRPDEDDGAVVDVLARAYEGTGDGGWTRARFAAKRELPWFRAEDLLLAESAGPTEAAGTGHATDPADSSDPATGAATDRGAADDGRAVPGHRLLGLHWLKRRGAGVGEVYNLAIHPAGQGRGAGALLLAAGLAHLREVGCHDVLLWVDRANERAVELYTSRGFTTRWDDVALEAPLDE